MHNVRRSTRAIRISIAACGVPAFLGGYTIAFAEAHTLNGAHINDGNIELGR